MKIEGIPAGYELVRIGTPNYGELFLNASGGVIPASGGGLDKNFIIVRKVEKPKTYRPFANAEEFKPHRDRWTRRIAYDPQGNDIYPPKRYSDLGYDGCKWQWCLELFI